jgi:hypothetical protein
MPDVSNYSLFISYRAILELQAQESFPRTTRKALQLTVTVQLETGLRAANFFNLGAIMVSAI